MGAAIKAVATLLSMSDSVIVTTMMMTNINTTDSPSVHSIMVFAINSAAPLLSSAIPIGISEPSNTMTGHSIDSYNCVKGTSPAIT